MKRIKPLHTPPILLLINGTEFSSKKLQSEENTLGPLIDFIINIVILPKRA